MLEFKTRSVAPSMALLAAITLAGCSASKDGPPMPPPPLDPVVAEFNPLAGSLPFPTDLLFAGTTDGTLNIPATMVWHAASNVAAMNALDGFSTTATMVTGFSGPIDANSISGSTVKVVEMYLSNTTKAPAQGAELPVDVASPVIRVLTYGTDYTADVSPDYDSAGKVLRITPLKPLRPSTGATNIGYLVILTNGIQSGGKATAPSETYASIKSAPADCSSVTNPTLNAVCRLTKAHLAIAGAVGTSADSVTLTWSFSTQNTSDTLGYLAAAVPAQTITVNPTGLTTHDALAALAGKANIYVGKTTVPYYSAIPASTHDPVILTTHWNAAGASPVPGLDPASRNLTRFNPVPAKITDIAIPVLLTVPNATAHGGTGCTKPVAGWPVAIVHHGLGGDRTQALAMADSFADACFVVASIDHPLHGITNTASPLFCSPTNPACLGARERTFDIDLVNNTTGASTPDGIPDASGSYWINLSSPLTMRDTIRQGEADLVVFAKTLTTLDIDHDTVADIDPTRIHFVGLSLGGLMGSAFVKFSPTIRTATVAVPGGQIVQLGLDSPTFGPRLRAGVAAGGLVDNSYTFNVFFRDAQTVADSADPINHIQGSQARHPLHLMKVIGDTVIPNSATDRLIVAGGLTKLSSGTHAVGAGTGAYTTFTAGSHGSLFDPTTSPAATVEMQTQAVTFAASAVVPGGPFLTITNTTVIQP
jgi:hypothetical protein